MPDRPTAPQNAVEAAAQLNDLIGDLEQARTWARQYGTAADRAEHLYRREKSKALLQVDGTSDKLRESQAHEWPLAPSVRVESAQVAEAMGLSADDPATTVGELRWMRDRAMRLAEGWSATAYDRRQAVQGWMTVAAMARSEAELASFPTEHRRAS